MYNRWNGDAELRWSGENGDAELCCGGITATQVKVKWYWLREDSSSLGEGNAQRQAIYNHYLQIHHTLRSAPYHLHSDNPSQPRHRTPSIARHLLQQSID
jgi:hypothetical protein